MTKRLTPIFLLLGLAAAALPLSRAPKGELDLRGFARLPVLEGGRVKPLDSFARNTLLSIRGKQTARVEGRSMPAVEWLADALWRPEAADTYPVFTIDDPEVVGLLGLDRVPGRAYPYWQIEPKRKEVRDQAQAAEAVEGPRRSRFQSSVVNLDQRLELYERVKNTLMISGDSDPARDLEDLRASLPEALKAMTSPRPGAAGRTALSFPVSGTLPFPRGARPSSPWPPESQDRRRLGVHRRGLVPSGRTGPAPGLEPLARPAGPGASAIPPPSPLRFRPP